ncbi:hypothetical protein EK904_006460 [Melospiza melodia maxima]|nr:hypothetical protein EK904_006460 [Melospiza melodia maxima]
MPMPLTSIYLQHEGQKTWMLHSFGCCFSLNWKSQLTSSYNIPTSQFSPISPWFKNNWTDHTLASYGKKETITAPPIKANRTV